MVNQDPITDGHMPVAGRFIGGVFGLVFLGVGVSVIIFLWSAPFGEFGSPPLFFRVIRQFHRRGFRRFRRHFRVRCNQGRPSWSATARWIQSHGTAAAFGPASLRVSQVRCSAQF